MSSDINTTVKRLELSLKNISLTQVERLDILNALFQLKSNSTDDKLKSNLYQTAKELILVYLQSLDNRSYLYDKFNITYLFDIVTVFPKEQQLALCNYAIRKLRNFGYDEESNNLKKRVKEVDLKVSFKNLPSNFFQFLVKLILKASLS